MAIGDYDPTVWQNGAGVGHPPINEDNLNHFEEKIDEIDDYLYNLMQNYRFDSLKRYFWMRNCKEIHMFDDEGDWTPTAGTRVEEASDPITGNEDVTFCDDDNVAGIIEMHDDTVNLDLTEFNDELESTTDDIICLSISILNHTAFSAGLTLRIGEDNANYYSITWPMNETGRVTFMAKKSDFAQTGVPAGGWGLITYISLETTTLINKFGFTISCLSLMMYRNDPINDGQGQPFQIYSGSAWNNFFEQDEDVVGPPIIFMSKWNLHFDPNINDLGIQCLNDSILSEQYDGLKIKSDVTNFVWQSIMLVRYDDYTNNMTWFVDDDNYATTWIDDDDFTLLVNEAGAPTDYTFTLNTSLDHGERVEIKLEKNGDTIRATLIKGNERIAILEHETTIDTDTEGDLYFGYDDAGLCFIPDFMVSNINNMDLDSWDKPKIVYKQYDETQNNLANLQNDDDLYANLPPNGMFEISVFLIIDANHDTPDFQFDYTISGTCTVLNRRVGAGMGISSTNGYDSEYINISAALYTQAKYVGVDSAGYASVIDSMLVKTGVTGGRIQLRWAQYVAHASDTILIAGSWMKITKVDQLQRNR